MYVYTAGLGSYRRRRLAMNGLGACNAVMGSDGSARVVCDTPTNVDTVLPSGTNVIQDSAGNVVFASSASLVPSIPNWVLGVVGGVAALLFLKAGR